jgi:hypothetical protein
MDTVDTFSFYVLVSPYGYDIVMSYFKNHGLYGNYPRARRAHIRQAIRLLDGEITNEVVLHYFSLDHAQYDDHQQTINDSTLINRCLRAEIRNVLYQNRGDVERQREALEMLLAETDEYRLARGVERTNAVLRVIRTSYISLVSSKHDEASRSSFSIQDITEIHGTVFELGKTILMMTYLLDVMSLTPLHEAKAEGLTNQRLLQLRCLTPLHEAKAEGLTNQRLLQLRCLTPLHEKAEGFECLTNRRLLQLRCLTPLHEKAEGFECLTNRRLLQRSCLTNRRLLQLRCLRMTSENYTAV